MTSSGSLVEHPLFLNFGFESLQRFFDETLANGAFLVDRFCGVAERVRNGDAGHDPVGADRL